MTRQAQLKKLQHQRKRLLSYLTGTHRPPAVHDKLRLCGEIAQLHNHILTLEAMPYAQRNDTIKTHTLYLPSTIND